MNHLTNEQLKKIIRYCDKAMEIKCDVYSFAYGCYPLLKRSLAKVTCMRPDVSGEDIENFTFLVDAYEKAVGGMREELGTVRKRKSSFYLFDLKPYLP